MAAERSDVIWSPKHDDDRFLVLGNGELSLYQLIILESCKYAYRKVWTPSSEIVSNVTCASWCPATDETFLAVSTCNQLQPNLAKSLIYHVEKERSRELNAKRACSYLEWNAERPEVLAAGFTCSSSGRAIAFYNVPLSAFSTNSQPIKTASEHFHGEASAQGAWLTASQFVAAMNGRPRGGQLRIVDCEAPSASVRFHVASACVAQGLCIEPTERKLIAVHGRLEETVSSRVEAISASWGDEATGKYVIEIWNAANTERAYCTVPLDRPVRSMKWSPVRPLLLGVLLQSSNEILVLDFSRVAVSQDRPTPVTFHCSCSRVQTLVDVAIGVDASACAPAGSSRSHDSTLTAFSWTAVNKNLLVALTDTGSLELLSFHEKVSVAWRAADEPGGDESVQLAFDSASFPDAALSRTEVAAGYIRDVAQRMCLRASRGYGLYDPLTYLRNATPFGFDFDSSLRTAWERISVLCCWRNRYYAALADVVDRDVLFKVCTSTICLDETDEDAQDGMLDAASFDSWSKYVLPERAVFIAVAQSQYSKALNLLPMIERLSLEDLRMLNDLLIAASLEQQPDVYDSASLQRLANVVESNAYLRSIVEFLTHRNEPERVLLQASLPISDRVAFCCQQVTDSARFTECVRAFMLYTIERGDLDGLLLTGFTADSLSIIQAFLDRSYDVQSATLFALTLFERSELVIRSRPFRAWFEAYREFLNRNRMWIQRARFDVRFKVALASGVATRPHIHVCCSSCGARISQAQAIPAAPSGSTSSNLLVSPTPNLTPHDPSQSQSHAQVQTPVRSRKASSPGAVTTGAQAQQSAMRGAARTSVCANASCKKPLPKCAVCLLTLGLPLGEPPLEDGPDEVELDAEGQILLAERGFFEWLCVCVRCRHGGHTAHVLEWFRSHAYCPVADCTCRCNMLDQLV